MDTTHSLIKSVKHFFSGTLLSRLTGMLRDIVMAFVFGAHANIAAFFVAYRFAHLFRRVLGEGALQVAFIPKFEELRKDDPVRACRFFRDLYGVISLALLGLIMASLGGLGSILYFFEVSEGVREILLLALLMMPSLFFICLFGLNSSLLQCEKKYFTPGVAPVFFNLTWIAGVLTIGFFHVSYPMVWLSGIIILACFSQWLITVPQTLKILRSQGISHLWSEACIRSKDLKIIGKPLTLGVLGVAAAQINNALDGIFARYADAEGPALLWYAIRIQQVPIGLFAIAFSGALLPPLTRSIKENDREKFHHLLFYSIKRCLGIMIPFTLFIFLFGKMGIEWVYGRGQFDQQAVDGTAMCLYAYTLGLVPMALVLVVAPAFYSQNNYAVPTGASVVSMGVNIVLNGIFVFGLGFGAVSVALATAASSWVNFLILMIILLKNSAKIRFLSFDS